jgi:hypothetical protein
MRVSLSTIHVSQIYQHSRAEGTVRSALAHGFRIVTPVAPVIIDTERDSIMCFGVAEDQSPPREKDGKRGCRTRSTTAHEERHVFTTELIRCLPRPNLASPVIN